MKNLILSIAVLASAHSFAGTAIMEFDEAQEIKCHSEARSLGCLNSKGEANNKCIEAKKVKLSKPCLSMHKTKMKTR